MISVSKTGHNQSISVNNKNSKQPVKKSFVKIAENE